MKMWEGKQVVGFLLTWRLLRHQLQQQMTDKYIILFCYIGAQLDLTQVMTLHKKVKAQPLSLIGHMWIVNCEIVNSDRQFCGTVYVISWTVALILSSRKSGTRVCIIPRLCWQNKELFCMKSGQIQQRRLIYVTQEFWHQKGNLTLKFCSLMNC